VVVANAVLVLRELAHAAVHSQIDACVEVAVQIVADEVSVMLDIGADFHMKASRCSLDCDGELLQPAEEAGQLTDLRSDVLADGLGQFHVLRCDGDEHVGLPLGGSDRGACTEGNTPPV